MSMTVEIRGLRELDEALDKLEPRDAKKVQQKALAEAGKYLKPKVVAATPWPSYRRAVSVKAAKKNKPAQLVAYNAKKAPFRHIMIGGSRAHSTRAKRPGKSEVQAFSAGSMTVFSAGHNVSGVKGTPVIDRVADQYGDDALLRAEQHLVKALGLDE